ncbi:MAG TPA: hypothetical protein ENJ41_01015 [Oceanospirillales bacterium]|nr:hypothetical protein [Oceanospirillales bacterium]
MENNSYKIKTDELSKEWIEAYTNEESNDVDLHWAIEYVIELAYKSNYDELWKFIKHTYQQDILQKIISILAAGPMEDLLLKAGEQYIDDIKELARKYPKFNYLLGGVWQNYISADVWMRVLKARNEAW